MSLAIIGQLLLKSGLALKELGPNFANLISVIFSPKIFAGFLLYGISSIIWLFVLKRFPLSVAYPALSLSYIAIILLSWRYFEEPLTLYKLLGSVLIVLGVYVLFK